MAIRTVMFQVFNCYHWQNRAPGKEFIQLLTTSIASLMIDESDLDFPIFCRIFLSDGV